MPSSDLRVAEAMIEIDHLAANDIPLFFDDSLREIAAQELPDIDPNSVPIRQRSRPRTGSSRTRIGRSARYFQRADALIVIARNLQEDVAARPGESRMSSASSKLGLFETRVLDLEALSWKRPPMARRDGGDRSDPSRCRCGRRCDLPAASTCARFQFHAVDHGVDIAQRHAHFQTKGDFQGAFASARVRVGPDRHLSGRARILRQRDILLRVE